MDARGQDYVFTTALMAAAENHFNFTKEIIAATISDASAIHCAGGPGVSSDG